MSVDCNTCANRGCVNGMSQEAYCEQCIYGNKWKKDYYVPKEVEETKEDS